jgi:alkaline phosphatase
VRDEGRVPAIGAWYRGSTKETVDVPPPQWVSSRSCYRLFGTAARCVTAVAVLLALVLYDTGPSAQVVAGDGRYRPSRVLASNIIIMISDGCGYNHIDATDMYVAGETGVQPYEQFAVRYAMSTYSADGHGYDPAQAWADFDYVNHGYTDSAAAGTALSTGHKTHNVAIGVDVDGNVLRNILEMAEERGKATGVVTTVPFSHATPAGFVAHNAYRGNYAEIAQQMLLDSAVDVIMGAGHPWFDNDGNRVDSPIDFAYVGGEQLWEQLVAGSVGGDADGDGSADGWALIQTQAQFRALASGATPKRVLGVAQVFAALQQQRTDERGRPAVAQLSLYRDDPPYYVALNDGVPTLEEMTRAALNVLDDDPDGLFLMVEGGAVDWAAHANESGRMIEEQIDFSGAVAAVVAWVEQNSNWMETLLIVTADHETGYLTGPGSDPGWQPLVNNGRGQLPGMEWHSTQHTNQLVPLFVHGEAAVFLDGYADEFDPVRGAYIDNTEIAAFLFRAMDAQLFCLYLPILERRASPPIAAKNLNQ